jgi:hypothetical protein
MTRSARHIFRKILIIVAILMSVLAVLAAPYGVFWLRWGNPTTEIPGLENGPTESVAGMGLAPGLEKDFLQVLAEARRTGSMPAISAAIGRNGQMVWAGTNGFALSVIDIDHRLISMRLCARFIRSGEIRQG